MIFLFLKVVQRFQTYLERTSCEKKSCNGQFTEYSREIPSHPSREYSNEDIFSSGESILEEPKEDILELKMRKNKISFFPG